MPITLIILIILVIATIVVGSTLEGKTKEVSRLEGKVDDARRKDEQEVTPDTRASSMFSSRGMVDNTSVALGALSEAETARKAYKIATYVLLGLTVVVFLISIVAIVGTKKVGVVTSFNRPVGTLSNGLHLKAPWQKVHELDGAIQTDSHNDTTIRLGNQSTATVRNSIRWRIKPGTADELYRDYRDFDKIRDSLVTRELTAALNDVFKSYDPLRSIKEKSATTEIETPSELADDVAVALRKRIGDQIDVINVIIPIADYDPATQGRINAFQEEIANTRIAEQKQKTAAANAAANRKLSSSVSRDPNVLVSKCLDTLAEVAKAQQPLPAGFSCWPGGRESAIAVK
ncbi:hypothetical protein A3F64_01060 [Candidatus Saccharibacteria bacterium RIFCSPHIGHO2_12_FULL_42_8]|nr:MAG: hypothetical protein A3F64_01060 [Candidatus Saccharibacteria bacterium RIFCSPHIGHO2_12_FULL_42_8]